MTGILPGPRRRRHRAAGRGGGRQRGHAARQGQHRRHCARGGEAARAAGRAGRPAGHVAALRARRNLDPLERMAQSVLRQMLKESFSCGALRPRPHLMRLRLRSFFRGAAPGPPPASGAISASIPVAQNPSTLPCAWVAFRRAHDSARHGRQASQQRRDYFGVPQGREPQPGWRGWAATFARGGAGGAQPPRKQCGQQHTRGAGGARSPRKT